MVITGLRLATHILHPGLVLATLATKYRGPGQNGFPSKLMLMFLKERFLQNNVSRFKSLQPTFDVWRSVADLLLISMLSVFCLIKSGQVI